MLNIRTIGIVGAGQMGRGIALTAALHGFAVLLNDNNPDAVKAAQRKIENSLDRMHTDGKLTHRGMRECLARIRPITLTGNPGSETHGMQNAYFVIETITEDREAKKNLYKVLESILPKEAIIVTNTSCIPILELAQSVERKDRFMGMHFMNPPNAVTLLEVIRGPETSDETFGTVMEVARKLGRTPIVEAQDFTGFMVNRLVLPLINEAAHLVGGGASPEDVDQVFEVRVKTGGEPIGVLRLADFIGIDTCVSGLREMARGCSYYEPCTTLHNMVDEGHLGRKTGKGFFMYGK